MTLYKLEFGKLDETKVGVQAHTVLLSTTKPPTWWGAVEEEDRLEELNKHLPNITDIQKMAVIGQIMDICRYK